MLKDVLKEAAQDLTTDSGKLYVIGSLIGCVAFVIAIQKSFRQLLEGTHDVSATLSSLFLVISFGLKLSYISEKKLACVILTTWIVGWSLNTLLCIIALFIPAHRGAPHDAHTYAPQANTSSKPTRMLLLHTPTRRTQHAARHAAATRRTPVVRTPVAHAKSRTPVVRTLKSRTRRKRPTSRTRRKRPTSRTRRKRPTTVLRCGLI